MFSQKSRSWISDEDIYKPDTYASGGSEELEDVESTQINGTPSPVTEPESMTSPPSVVRRRQIGKHTIPVHFKRCISTYYANILQPTLWKVVES